MSRQADVLNFTAPDVKNFVNYNVEQGKQLTSSARGAIRRAGAQVLEVIKTSTRPVVQVFEKADNDGTELRKQISSVRVQVNKQLHGAEVRACISPSHSVSVCGCIIPVAAPLYEAPTLSVRVQIP